METQQNQEQHLEPIELIFILTIMIFMATGFYHINRMYQAKSHPLSQKNTDNTKALQTLKQAKLQRANYLSHKKPKLNQSDHLNQNIYVQLKYPIQYQEYKQQEVVSMRKRNQLCYKKLKNLAYHYNQYENQLTTISRFQQQIEKQRKICLKTKNDKIKNVKQIHQFPKNQIKRAESVILQISEGQESIDNKSDTKPVNPLNLLSHQVKDTKFSKNEDDGIKIFSKSSSQKPQFNFGTFFNNHSNGLKIEKTENNIYQSNKNQTDEKLKKLAIKIQNQLKQQQNIIQSKQNIQNKPEQARKEQQNPLKNEQILRQKQKPKILVVPSDPSIILPTINHNVSHAQIIQQVLNYSKTIKPLIEIRTRINNLGGARSEPEQIYKFVKSYLTTISSQSPEQIITFAYKIYDIIVFKSIKNTNVKDGFEKMPPREKSKQAVKNQLNTYIMIINLFRVISEKGESIWIGIISKMIGFMQFLFNRKEQIKKFEELELIQNGYIKLDSDITFFYLSRLDFLTYFLFGLLTFDPLQILKEIKSVTNQTFEFEEQLSRKKHRWDYQLFWPIFNSLKNNKLDTYWKIPMWINMYSAIYLQILKYKQTSQMKQFFLCGKWIFKEVARLVKNQSSERKTIKKFQIERDYEFQGDQFISSIQTLGKRFLEKQKDLIDPNPQNYRDNNSVMYYFWRKS